MYNDSNHLMSLNRIDEQRWLDECKIQTIFHSLVTVHRIVNTLACALINKEGSWIIIAYKNLELAPHKDGWKIGRLG